MKFSIVTLSFNQAQFLRQCMDSVLSQSDIDLEYILVDPGSVDGSREIIEEYGGRVIKVFESDSGPANGLNNGFACATGDIFGFINADDYLLPGSLSIISSHFEEYGLDHFVTGSGLIEYMDGRCRQLTPTLLRLDPFLYGACSVFQQGTFFPASVFHAVGGFNEENRTCWDGELFVDFIAAGYTHTLVKRDLAVFRIHAGSISGSGRLRSSYEIDRKRIFRKIKNRDYAILDVPVGWWWRIKKVGRRAITERFLGLTR